MKSSKIGYIYVGLAATFFAIIGVIGKSAINLGIAPLDLIVLQYATTTVILMVYFFAKDISLFKLEKTQAKSMLIQGMIGSTGTTIFFFMALERMNAGIASMLLFTHPVLISIYFLLSKTKKINAINNIALLLAVTGSALVINIFAFNIVKTPFIGLLFGMLASASYAFFNVYAEVKLQGLKPITMTFYGTIIILAIALIINPSFFNFNFELTGKMVFYILELAIISGIFPVVLIYKGIALVGADKASIVATAELPITVLLAYFILGERLNLVQGAGIVFIIVSIILLQNENNILSRVSKGRKE